MYPSTPQTYFFPSILMFCHWICMFFCPIEQLSLPDLDLVSLWNSKDQWHLLFQMKLMFVCTFQWSFWLSTSEASVSQTRCSDVLVCCASGPSTSLSLSLSQSWLDPVCFFCQISRVWNGLHLSEKQQGNVFPVKMCLCLAWT